jgi:hypothetical protein
VYTGIHHDRCRIAAIVSPGIPTLARRAAAKAAGAKRIDVTLQGDALDRFEQVRAWLDRNNRTMIERSVYNNWVRRERIAEGLE